MSKSGKRIVAFKGKNQGRGRIPEPTLQETVKPEFSYPVFSFKHACKRNYLLSEWTKMNFRD
ncbi:hypothetical protein B7C51_20590 [Paenibacillus larvae subsp. pulvifaciens]|uniref:Uncharacterized protein n=1 Tax=Paenibacillus larvae subsp. pulvifaciens TaxID=1477 RepID=A0A1V0UX31_9BACL|nr:hypothetical protein B7C51_19545 [Paenibacillus larvae subsp. pulvifaciens]ARF69722.1 hypothetical protein B7C51_20590 [Paenibacillus larvae subsp. pulvifaciens]